MKKRVIVKIYGLVQGVGYRAVVLYNARELKLKGYIQNQKDGSVLIVCEEEKNKLEQLVKKCYNGPGEIERVIVEWEEYRGEFKGFEIK